MGSKILILSGKPTREYNHFVWYQVEKQNKYDIRFSGNDQIKYNYDYIFCIIDFHALVEEILNVSRRVKRFYSMPVCVFETNIIERYPGEKERLKNDVDFIIPQIFSRKDFLVLVNNILKHRMLVGNSKELIVNRGIMRIHPTKRTLYINDIQIFLTKTEFDIFYYLFKKNGAVVAYKELYEQIWKKEYIHDGSNIMAHIHRLREKVEMDPKNPKYICNQYGVGYYFGNMR